MGITEPPIQHPLVRKDGILETGWASQFSIIWRSVSELLSGVSSYSSDDLEITKINNKVYFIDTGEIATGTYIVPDWLPFQVLTCYTYDTTKWVQGDPATIENGLLTIPNNVGINRVSSIVIRG